MKSSDRTYLHVPPEERAEVEAAGARWDAQAKCWYVGSDNNKSGFARWLPDADGDVEAEIDAELELSSSEAYVASAQVPCRSCGASIEVICIYCETGIDADEPLAHFTVSNICAMDESLADQLARWPHFKRSTAATQSDGCYTNYCPHCSAPQEDMYLHDEPDDPFFSIPHFPPPTLQLMPLIGLIRLSGSYHFSI